MSPTLSAIEKLAKTLAEKAAQDSTSVTEMTEAAKVLAPYYTALKKAEGADEPPDDGLTMSGMQETIRAASEDGHDGRSVSRGSRRRN